MPGPKPRELGHNGTARRASRYRGMYNGAWRMENAPPRAPRGQGVGLAPTARGYVRRRDQRPAVVRSRTGREENGPTAISSSIDAPPSLEAGLAWLAWLGSSPVSHWLPRRGGSVLATRYVPRLGRIPFPTGHMGGRAASPLKSRSRTCRPDSDACGSSDRRPPTIRRRRPRPRDVCKPPADFVRLRLAARPRPPSPGRSIAGRATRRPYEGILQPRLPAM